jgi:aminoglycoside 6'-N-acetyltransferase
MSENTITLRPATLADVGLLRRWDEQPHVIASDPNDDWQWESELARRPDWREQLIAEVDGRPVGFVQIIDPQREETRYWGDVPPNLRAIDIWIGDKADLGQGYGSRIMNLVLGRCFSDPTVSAVLIDPLAGNVGAHRFYERLGFRFIERRRFGADNCFVYRLDRTDYWP